MADVNPFSGRERAQLILVSGLVIAVSLILLVLLLNTVIFTDNVATRGIADETGDALKVQTNAEREILTYTESVTGADGAAKATAVEAAGERLFAHLETTHGERGIQLQGNVSARPGYALSDEEIDLEPDDSMTLGSGVADVDEFSIRVNGADLSDSSEPEDSLELNVNGGDWVLYFDRVNGDEVELRDESGPICDGESFDDPTVNFVTSEVNGESCDDLWDEDIEPPGVNEPFDMELIANDDNGVGAFTLVAAGDGEIVYDVTIDFVYRTPTLTYNTTTTVEGAERP